MRAAAVPQTAKPPPTPNAGVGTNNIKNLRPVEQLDLRAAEDVRQNESPQRHEEHDGDREEDPGDGDLEGGERKQKKERG